MRLNPGWVYDVTREDLAFNSMTPTLTWLAGIKRICTFVHFYIYEVSWRSHLCSLGGGRGALVRDFPHRGDLVCDRRGTHSSPELATLDHSRIRRSCCAADSTFHPVCIALRRRSMCWTGWGRDGRRPISLWARCGQDRRYGVIIMGQGVKNVKVVIVIENFPSTDFPKCIISKNVQSLRSYA